MKTLVGTINNEPGRMLVLFAAILFIALSQSTVMANSKQIGDNEPYITITGKVIDNTSHTPVTYANIYIVGTSIGTVANSEGEFILKVPKNKSAESIGITHLGYKKYVVAIEKMNNGNNDILLEPEIVPLKEIVIRSEDPIILLKGAIHNISKNYRTQPSMLTGFYRETVQQNKKYVSVAEAVLEAYKASYTGFSNDKVKIIIGRKGQDVKRMDTLVVKLQGGPITPFYLDVVKNPQAILSEDYFQYYNYRLTGQVSLDNVRCYVIEFDQKENVDQPLYKGKIYLDVDKLAVAGLEFSLSEYALPKANSLFLMKKPLTLKFETLGADYYVRYAELNGKWNLNYVRSELRFKCKWHKKLFSSNYIAMVEMAVTDIDTTDITKFKSAETTKFTDIFSDKAEDFKNAEFWGDYNIIKPEESIQSAIAKISKRMKKH